MKYRPLLKRSGTLAPGHKVASQRLEAALRVRPLEKSGDGQRCRHRRQGWIVKMHTIVVSDSGFYVEEKRIGEKRSGWIQRQVQA